MALVSLAAYAAQHGATKQAAAKWKARNALVIRDGKVDVEPSDRLMLHAGLGRFREPPTGATTDNLKPSTGQPTAPLVDDQAIDLADPETQRTLNAFVEQLLTGRYSDFTTASVVKENALALKHVLAARREAGSLIDLETAEAVLFEVARLARDAWMNFPSRMGPLIAAEVGVDTDRLVEALSAHVHQQLADIGEPEADFSGSGETGFSVPPGPDPAAEDQRSGMGGPV